MVPDFGEMKMEAGDFMQGGWLSNSFIIFLDTFATRQQCYKGTFLNKQISPLQLSILTKQMGIQFGDLFDFSKYVILKKFVRLNIY